MTPTAAVHGPRAPALLAGALLLAIGCLLGSCGRGGTDAAAGAAFLTQLPPAPDGAWVLSVEVRGGRRVVTARDGRVASLPLAPQRVVSLLPGITELVAALAGPDVLVGVSPWCDFPPEVRGKPTLSVQPVDVERLASLAPDLVLCDATLHAASLQQIESRAPASLALESRSLPHLVATVRLLGDVLGSEASRSRAAALVADLEAAAAEARAGAPALPLRVLLVGQADPLNVLGPGSLLDDLLRLTGCVNVAADLGRASGPFGVESVLARSPDWILTTSETLPEALRARWAGVPAVQRGQVALARADDLLRAGPRTPAALRRLAAVLRGALPPGRLAGGP